MQRNGTNIKTADKHRLVILVSGSHATTLIPRREECTTTHRTHNPSVLLVHRSDIPITSQRQPVRIHRLAGAIQRLFKDILTRLSDAMQILVIEKHKLGEEDRLLITLLALAVLMDTQEGLRAHLLERTSSESERHCDEGIVSTRAADGVELHLNTLEALLKVSLDLFESVRHGIFEVGVHNPNNVLIL